ncbi:hypothetical protein [Pedobacter sp.]
MKTFALTIGLILTLNFFCSGQAVFPFKIGNQKLYVEGKMFANHNYSQLNYVQPPEKVATLRSKEDSLTITYLNLVSEPLGKFSNWTKEHESIINLSFIKGILISQYIRLKYKKDQYSIMLSDYNLMVKKLSPQFKVLYDLRIRNDREEVIGEGVRFGNMQNYNKEGLVTIIQFEPIYNSVKSPTGEYTTEGDFIEGYQIKLIQENYVLFGLPKQR